MKPNVFRIPVSPHNGALFAENATVIYRSRMHAKTKRNFEIFSAEEFIAAITQHIPNKGLQMVRYYGWYSNRARGDRARHHDSTRAAQLCAGMNAGDVLTADRAYVDLSFLFDLEQRGIFFVLREKKKNMLFDILETRASADARIISDQIVTVSAKKTAENYPQPLRRVTAIVEVDGKDVVMSFLTNNMQWSPRTITELYRSRWSIEIFFKEIKQTLQLSDFVGYNAKAVKWQVWIGLLAHLLLRFLKHVSEWKLSFSRLAGTVRSTVWMKIDLLGFLRRYGTAGAPKPMAIVEIHPVFKGFERE